MGVRSLSVTSISEASPAICPRGRATACFQSTTHFSFASTSGIGRTRRSRCSSVARG
jgi:hypothetical protein